MMRKFLYILAFAAVSVATSCIENDVPYPYQLLEINSVEGEGFTTSIDGLKRVVTLNLEESCDIQNVTIDEVVYSEPAKLSREITGTFDFTKPLLVTLYNYQSYDWKIEAVQNIERTFKVVGQIGKADIDAEKHIVSLVVSDKIDPASMQVTEMKLGAAEISTTTPAKEELTNFESVRQIYVTTHGRKETWRVYVSFEKASIEMDLCTFLARVAWVSTTGDTSSGEECGYLYRKVADKEWTKVVVEPAGGTFSTQIEDLEPETEYEIKSYIGEMESASQIHTTESATQLANSGFEEWCKDSWVRPYSLGELDPVWDSGNQGAKSGGAVLTESDTDVRPGSKGQYSARLTSENVLVKFAAGNLFVGKYTDTYFTDGIIAFGYPFTQRPLALRGWYRYNCGVIDIKGSKLPASVVNSIVVGETPDIGTIYVALGKWTPKSYAIGGKTYPADSKNPLYICTADQSTFFDPKGEDVIAYGALEKSESVSEWTEFEIPLEYYDKTSIPTHIIVVASTSRYGDYFTGSTDSQMWIDDFELVY